MQPVQSPRSLESERRLESLAQQLLRDRTLLVASNRGPVEHHLSQNEVQAVRGTGGVATILESLVRYLPYTCIASALTEGDRHVARTSERPYLVPIESRHPLRLHYVVSPRVAYQRYYNVFSNPFLWFLQHTMWDLPYSPNIDDNLHAAWERGYAAVNASFAEAITSEAISERKPAVVLLHDYHLYLTGGMVRRSLPDALIQHFVHIPWPGPRYWAMLPPYMRNAILESLCACNIVGFQTPRDAGNFLLTCQDLLPGAEVDYTTRAVHLGRNTVLVRHYPVSIDVTALRELVQSPDLQEYQRRMLPMTREKTIVRVDRLEPSKNILRGFLAYEVLLARHPELHGDVTFLAFLMPSRTDIREYQSYRNEVMDVIQRINSNFGRGAWRPVRLFYQENFPQAIAAMGLADVFLVNPVVDGMNLVAKEGPTVSQRHGVLVLSVTTGAYGELAPASSPSPPSTSRAPPRPSTRPSPCPRTSGSASSTRCAASSSRRTRPAGSRPRWRTSSPSRAEPLFQPR